MNRCWRGLEQHTHTVEEPSPRRAGEPGVWGAGAPGRARTRRTRVYCTCQKHFKGTCGSGDWPPRASISGVARRRGNCSARRLRGDLELAYLHCRSDVINLLVAAARRAPATDQSEPAAPQLVQSPRGGFEGHWGEEGSVRGLRRRSPPARLGGGGFVRSPLPSVGSPPGLHPQPGRGGGDPSSQT